MVQFLERNCEARPPVWNWSLWKWKQVTEAEEVLLGSKGRDDLRNSSNNPPPPLLKLFWNNFSTIPQEFTSAYHRQQIWSVPRKICQQILFRKKHCKNCEYCPLKWWVTVNDMVVVLNCQKCDQRLKGHKSLGSLFQGVLSFSLSLSSLSSVSPHHSDQMFQRSEGPIGVRIPEADADDDGKVGGVV